MIWSAGGVSGYSSRSGYSGERKTRVEGISRVSAVAAVSETKYVAGDEKRENSSTQQKDEFQELFEKSKNMPEQESLLLSTDEIKMTVLKQVIERILIIAGKNLSNEKKSSSALRMQWIKTAVDSVFLKDVCCVAYKSSGFALTASGKMFTYGICVEMSEKLCEKYESYTQETNRITEPVLVRVDDRITHIADICCLLDLDCTTENEYQETDIYHKLKVRMKDVNGNDIDVDLREENAGMAYQRGLLESYRIGNRACIGKTLQPELYEPADEQYGKNHNVDFSV